MIDKECDLLVIGGGSGGVAAARRAAEYGAEVVVCEEDRLGGTCVHRGCVPKKLLVYAAAYAEHFKDALGYGWSIGNSSFSWLELRQAKDKELNRLNSFYEKMLTQSGITRIKGRARFVAPRTVEVEGRRVRGRRCIIAVGSKPWLPEFEGKELVSVSDDIFNLEQLPERIVVMGSGYIGAEFASLFCSLGSDVTMIFRSPMVLPAFDDELRQALQAELEARGIRFFTGSRVKRVNKHRSGLKVELEGGGELECDLFLGATGRVPNTARMGLEEIGVELGVTGAVKVAEGYVTSLPDTYAIGDCLGGKQLTPLAIAQGRLLAERLFNPDYDPATDPGDIDEALVPTAVFTYPETAMVGMTEKQAKKRNGSVKVYLTSFRPMKFTLAGRDSKVMMKLVVDAASDRVVGAHLMGEGASELIQLLAVAVRAGLTKHDFDNTVAVHPTSAEELVLMRYPVRR